MSAPIQKITPFLWFDHQAFTALNGGPYFKFTEAVSFVIHCESQEEIDRSWEKFLEGEKEDRCGWLKDKYGLSWQIVPAAFIEMMKDQDTARKGRVMEAMMQMKKLDIARLTQAYGGSA